MNTTAPGQVTTHSDRPFTLRLTVAALTAAGVLSSASVWAQDAAQVADKEAAAKDPAVVVVSGVRRAAGHSSSGVRGSP